MPFHTVRDGEITKAEYLREHSEFLRAMARCLKPNDKNRTTLLNMTHHFENLAEAAENEVRRSSADNNCRSKKKEALPRARILTRASVTV
jgi:hypothetical protein